MNKEIRELRFRTKKDAQSLLSGQTLSKIYGRGYDFANLREYEIGDDVSKINWNTTAKLGKPYIKESYTHKELNVVVVTLMDGTLYFDDSNLKQKYIAQIVSILGYATLYGLDLFNGISYTSSSTKSTPPTKQIYHIENFVESVLDSYLLHTKLNTISAIKDIFMRIQKPSLMFVVGDFLEEVDLSLLSQKHEVVAIIIRHHNEEILPCMDRVNLHNPTTSQTLDTSISRNIKKEYELKLKDHDTKLHEQLNKYGVKYIKLTTKDNIVQKMMELFL